ncbi:reticulon-1-A-like isoform X1 [Lethenteron reissneri]|uniref:reticulon-1-A-like isoform X1 n=1 Tax=Lethenteron reissneri TaxID=7753 RepID=UPI002AB70AC2|nr:reticulon-1-A-like isoform X1 [Lethenteron reissneri]
MSDESKSLLDHDDGGVVDVSTSRPGAMADGAAAAATTTPTPPSAKHGGHGAPLPDSTRVIPACSSSSCSAAHAGYACLAQWLKPQVLDLLYWRDIKKSAAVFGGSLLLLLSLTQFSVVSVLAYLTLAVLSVTISYRVYKSVLQAVQKTEDGHPFREYLEADLAMSPETAQKYVDTALAHVNCQLRRLRRLFLVHDLVDSIKFAVVLWLLTYVGALFNGLTIVILALIGAFTVPMVYEKYQVQIDQHVGLVRKHVGAVVEKVQAMIPGAKRKAE